MANSLLDDDENKKLMDWVKPQNVPRASIAQTPNNEPEASRVDERIADSAPGHTTDTLTPYLKGQENELAKYGPDQEKAVMDMIRKNRGSFGSRAATFGTGLGDAIMSVAGKQSPGFLNSLENDRANHEKQALESIPTLGKMTADQIENKNKLEGMMPTSPLGGTQAIAYQKVFKQLFPQMSASELAAITRNPSIAAKMFPEMGPIIDRQVQNELKKMQIEATIGNQKATQTNQAQQTRLEATKERAKLGPLDKLIFHRPENKLLKELEAGGTESHGIPELGSTFNGEKVTKVTRVK